MTTPLFLFTTDDAEYVLGRELTEAQRDELVKQMNRQLTQHAADLVLDVANQAPIEISYECPRCGHLIPRDEFPGVYPGAISRLDNQTEVCSLCGLDEAMGNGVVTRDFWPVKWHPKTLELDEGVAERIAQDLGMKPANAAPEGGESSDGS